MKNNIEWATPATATTADLTASKSGGQKYQDLRLKDEFADLAVKHRVGTEWFRILPAMTIGGQTHPEGAAFKSAEIDGVRYAFDGKAERAIWAAFNFLRSNPTRLAAIKGSLPKEQAALWAIRVEKDREKGTQELSLGILIGSAYDGSRGGAPGLIRNLIDLIVESDEAGKTIDPLNPAAGLLFGITKTAAAAAGQYASYRAKLGVSPAPLADYFGALTEEQRGRVSCGIQETIRMATGEELANALTAAGIVSESEWPEIMAADNRRG